ncbi:MAG TPA: nucleotidyltransferase [Terricaulis sp.]|nr:nucleotidyltransferase [Terricaulis sp.]
MYIPSHTEELLEDLAESLQIPPSRYEAAERSYKSVGKWLHRDASKVRDANPKVYIQGSFRLGTVIKPVSDKEDYDVDLVCEVSLSKTALTQEKLKQALGIELAAYAEAHKLNAPEEGKRCWTQTYADGAQFHLDTLPAIPDAARLRALLEQAGHPTRWVETSIAITDRDHPNFRMISPVWPLSNPKGYSNWFRSRMGTAYEARLKGLALERRASVEEIPEYNVRSPLQSAIQILKHHRDVMFVKRADDRPISIILTTLAALAYQQEQAIGPALLSMLTRMDQFIERRDGKAWIRNPTNPAENFADRWQRHPAREKAFYEWLQQARADFAGAVAASDRLGAAGVLRSRMGERLIEAAQSVRSRVSPQTVAGKLTALVRSLNPSHRQAPPWNYIEKGWVRIDRATCDRSGFRTRTFQSDETLPKHCDLRFEADTNIPRPHKVYWQVVNTGAEAAAKGQLRGGFDEGEITTGKLTRKESSLYAGTHSIECFIVKDGMLVARSGQFIVRIE